MANIWIVGATGSGKSTLAKRLSKETGLPILEAGSFCREMCDPRANCAVLTQRAVDVLTDDHRYFSRQVAEAIQVGNWIVAGARNPIDFTDSFNPKTDQVIFLTCLIPATPGFEHFGIGAIAAYANFLLTTGIVKDEQVRYVRARGQQEDWYASVHFEN